VTALHAVDRPVAVGLHSLELWGHLTVPTRAGGVVLIVGDPDFGQRDQPDDRFVRRLAAAGIATLRVDLLAPDERTRDRVQEPDADALAVRVLAVTRWLRAHPNTRDHGVAYFGSSAGADVALLAAAEDPTVSALVARNGRPDLVASRLEAVEAATLLVVDAADPEIVDGNCDALRHLRCEHDLVLVAPPGEPGDTELPAAVVDRAVDWFSRHLMPSETTRADAPERSDPRTEA
jgi:putative phosphoribosyl transferase